jgi:Tfp pilus assembly protein PilF
MTKHFDRAETLFRQSRYELAEKELRSEIAENPESTDVHTLLAVCIISRSVRLIVESDLC